MVSVSSHLQTELPKLSQKSGTVSQKNYSTVRNRLADQNHGPMNQTYTIGTRQLVPPSAKPRERSCSIDSDIAEYSIHGALSGLFPRTYNKSNGSLSSSAPSRSPSVGNCSLNKIYSTKLPSLDGCSPERKCCQRPFGRAQIDLQKYKETIKNAS